MALFKPKPANYGLPRALTAAAATVRLNDRATLEALQSRQASSSWQDEAWEFFDAIGELKYAFGLVAAVVSRVRMYPAVIVDQDSPPVAVADAVAVERTTESGVLGLSTDRGIDPRLARDANAAMESFAARTSIPRLLSTAALNLQIVGECYLANIPEEGSGWRAYSTSELRVTPSGSVTLRTSAATTNPNGIGTQINPTTALIGRIWRPHPRYSSDADSSMKALRADCDELLLLDRMVRTTIRSRMNAGILFVPDALSVAARTPVDPMHPDDSEGEDVFESELMAAMVQPISDEQDASAVVPLLVRGPADLGDRIKHTALGRDVSMALMERAQKVLERILQGMDVPKEVVQGLQDVKYANALVINEGMYKATIEPMAVLLADALTEIVLRPILRAQGWSDAEVGRLTVWYDPSEVVSKPDPAQSASEGYDRYLLSGDSWRQAHGFSDADAPRSAEIARRVALEKTQVTPEIAQVLMEKLLPELFKAERDANIAQDGGMPDDLTTALSGPDAAAQAPVDMSGGPAGLFQPAGGATSPAVKEVPLL